MLIHPQTTVELSIVWVHIIPVILGVGFSGIHIPLLDHLLGLLFLCASVFPWDEKGPYGIADSPQPILQVALVDLPTRAGLQAGGCISREGYHGGS